MRIAPEFICDCLCKYKYASDHEQKNNHDSNGLPMEEICAECPIRYRKADNSEKVASELKSISSELKNITKKLGGLKR